MVVLEEESFVGALVELRHHHVQQGSYAGEMDLQHHALALEDRRERLRLLLAFLVQLGDRFLVQMQPLPLAPGASLLLVVVDLVK